MQMVRPVNGYLAGAGPPPQRPRIDDWKNTYRRSGLHKQTALWAPKATRVTGLKG